MSEVARPEPKSTEYSEGFWAGIRRGELVIQRCTNCERLRHYPQPMCPDCHSVDFDWAPVTGRGVIYSYTVAHRAFHPAWKDDVPYVLATIELEEGVRMLTDLIGIDPNTVKIGQRVEVYFKELPGQGMMPRFRRVDAKSIG